MTHRTAGRRWLTLLVIAVFMASFLAAVPTRALADNTAQAVPFTQAWTDTALITANDSWTGVPGITGYRGDNLATTNQDARTVLGGDDTLPVVDVNANQTNPATYTSGGVTEFHITDPVVALQGSGTADAPYLLINISTTGLYNIRISYNVRDIDGAADNSVQQVALHYRVGTSGSFTDVPAAYIADATTGPSLATQVTPVSVRLPSAVNNQAVVQLRILTVDATGSDEWVGIDDISITDEGPAVTSTTPAADATLVAINSSITVTFSDAVAVSAGAFSLLCNSAPVTTTVNPALPATASSFEIIPSAVLPYEAACSFTVNSANVVDTDTTNPDSLAADYSFSFTVAPEETAPSVVATYPADNATGVDFDSSIILNFSELVTAAPGWYTITCNYSGSHTAAVANAGTLYVLNPSTDFIAGDLCTVTISAANVTDNDTMDPPDTMAADYTFDFSVSSGVCGDPVVGIHTVQGNGAASLFDNQVAVVEGVVVGDFHTDSTFNIFYIQEEDADADSDPTTSEGIGVSDGATPAVDVAIGDVVRVSGTVDEFNGLTELTGVTVTKCGTGTATPASLVLPAASLNVFEAVEGMRVTFPMTMTVTEHFNLARYGEITLSGEGRLFQFTHENAPNAANYTAFLNSLPLRTLLLDDRLSSQNPDPMIHPAPRLTYTNTLRIGDYTTGLSGVMSYDFSKYRILPDAGVTFTSANPRPETSPAVGGTFHVASMNTLNYFNTFADSNTGTPGCWPGGGDSDCRGANSQAEFDRQRAKLLDAILKMDAAVVGLMEIENDGYGADSAIQDLVKGLNEAAGAGTYAFIDADALIGGTRVLGIDAIKVALIYQPGRVTPVGQPATIEDALFERRPLAQAFKDNVTGGIVTVVVNHFKSKGCTGATGLDLDQGDGQSCFNARRTAQANALITWLASDPTGQKDPDFLVIGDLNSYAREDPVKAFINAGFVDLLNKFEGAHSYSYVFDGQSGYLDYALASASLVPQVNTATHWNINADEPRVLDYNLEFKTAAQQSYFYAPTGFRSSDHDPVLIGVNAAYRYIVRLPVINQGTAAP